MMYENIDFNSIDLTQEPPVSEPERQYYFIAKFHAHTFNSYW